MHDQNILPSKWNAAKYQGDLLGECEVICDGRPLPVHYRLSKSLNIQRKEWEIKLPIVTDKSTLRCKAKYFLRKIYFELYRQVQAFGTLVVC